MSRGIEMNEERKWERRKRRRKKNRRRRTSGIRNEGRTKIEKKEEKEVD